MGLLAVISGVLTPNPSSPPIESIYRGPITPFIPGRGPPCKYPPWNYNSLLLKICPIFPGKYKYHPKWLDFHGFSMAMLVSGRVFASFFHPWSRHQLFMKSTCRGFTTKDAQHGSRLIDVRQVHLPRRAPTNILLAGNPAMLDGKPPGKMGNKSWANCSFQGGFIYTCYHFSRQFLGHNVLLWNLSAPFETLDNLLKQHIFSTKWWWVQWWWIPWDPNP